MFHSLAIHTKFPASISVMMVKRQLTYSLEHNAVIPLFSSFRPAGKLKLQFDQLRKVLAECYETLFGPLAPSLVVSKMGSVSEDIHIGECRTRGVWRMLQCWYYTNRCGSLAAIGLTMHGPMVLCGEEARDCEIRWYELCK